MRINGENYGRLTEELLTTLQTAEEGDTVSVTESERASLALELLILKPVSALDWLGKDHVRLTWDTASAIRDRKKYTTLCGVWINPIDLDADTRIPDTHVEEFCDGCGRYFFLVKEEAGEMLHYCHWCEVLSNPS